MEKDNIFTLKNDPIPAFEFNEEVASVFDDMIKRSVPLYMESIKRQSQLAYQFYQTGTKIYDLGCSHGNLGVMIHEEFKNTPYTMVAVDSSPSMIERYSVKLQQFTNFNLSFKHHNNFDHNNSDKTNYIYSLTGPKAESRTKSELELEYVYSSTENDKNIHLVCSLAEEVEIANASVVIVNLTMQFIKPFLRDKFIRTIYEGMTRGGILLLTEKIIDQDSMILDISQSFYKRFKLENGYSELEISRKREALENILIPESLESHTKRLKNFGFNTIDVWLKWFNFASLIAIK